MHRDEIRIWKTRVPKSPYWVLRYIDPDTGQQRQKSARTENAKEAERQLGELRADLLNGRHKTPSGISWAAFRRKYEVEVLPGLAKKTQLKAATILDAVEALVQPKRLRDLNASRLSSFQAKLREGQRAESTIAGYLAHLRSALQWAVDTGMLPTLPKIQRPKRAKNSSLMKGRPISPAEFRRLLDHVAEVVGQAEAPSWIHYLEGLWWSGLRLSESLELYWDDDAKLCVTFQGDDVMLRIPAQLEKGNKDRLLPIAPEFEEFLRRVPPEQRHGRVFQPKAQKVHGERLTEDRVTRVVSTIGRKAEVLVNQALQKYATAHDLRRSFGERWAERVMPAVLMELMRHESITTTLKYYVGRNAQRTAKIVKEAYAVYSARDAERNAATRKTTDLSSQHTQGDVKSRDTLRDTCDLQQDTCK